MIEGLIRCRFCLALLLVTHVFAKTVQISDSKNTEAWTGVAAQSQLKTLLIAARENPGGIATTTLARYPGHFVMLAVRIKDGRPEMHKQDSDIIFVIDGQATVMTGGTILDAKEIAPQEIRGTKLVGGVSTILHKGDVMHISPGTPHRTLVAPGNVFIYYVIKVTQPK